MGASVFRPIPASGVPRAAVAPLLPDGRSAVARFLLTDRLSHTVNQHGRDASFDAAIGDYDCVSAAEADLRVRISVFGPGADPELSELGLMALSGILDAVSSSGGVQHRLGGQQPGYAAGLAGFTPTPAG